MEVIRLHAPVTDRQTVSFTWSCDPATSLYRGTGFELRFPVSIDLSRVPAAVWWRVALICLHSQWPLLRPCQIVLPVRLPPGEREFWLRMCDAEAATLEAHAGGNDVGRQIDIVGSGPPLEWPGPAQDPSLVVACFSGGRDSLAQTALLQELGLTPLLVVTSSPREGSLEHETARRRHVLAEIQSRRGLELVEVKSNLRSCWDNMYAAGRYQVAVSELTDTFLYFAAALAVAAARGASGVYLASESETLDSIEICGQIVQIKHFMFSEATQRSLSTLCAPLGISYGALTYPLRQFQLMRLLGKRYADLRDLQYSCWSMDRDEQVCSRCYSCLTNAFELMANGISPAEIEIDLVTLLRANADWRPRTEHASSVLPHVNIFWQFDLQLLRCLEKVTPEIAAAYIGEQWRHSEQATEALADYKRMRSRALAVGAEPEPGYRAGYLQLVEEQHRDALAAIFDEYFEREDEALHVARLQRSLALSGWITAPLARPELESLARRKPGALSGERHAPLR
jgi:7-cyano-7-deazaguanine synthase in queuosine biosynthesis